MGGVDSSNQMCNYLTCNRKSYAWVAKSFWAWVDLTIVQSILIYNRSTAGQKYKYKDPKTQEIKIKIITGVKIW